MVNRTSRRYHPGMQENDRDAPLQLACLVSHMGRRAGSRGGDAGLTPTQWNALRFFGNANRFSRTPSAFASFQGTTRGTASATISALVHAGYLVRRSSGSDGRSVSLEPSESGYRLLEQDPEHAVELAISEMTPEQRRCLAAAVTRIITRVAETDGGPTFGTCHECRHLSRSGLGGDYPYYCEREAAPLAAYELGGLCVHFEPDTRE